MNLLSIGGSDPSSGAGIQSDLKTFAALDSHGLTVITALTSQNTSKFGLVHPISKKNLKSQLDLIFSDFQVDGIKIGMVYNSDNIKIIFNVIRNKTVPIVLDPVIKSTTGGILLHKSALEDMKKYLIPLATAITPNKFEAEFITKKKITSKSSLKKVGRMIQKIGSKNVIITGLELTKNYVTDCVFSYEENFIHAKKIKSINHGSGCNYSAAMIFSLAQGKTVLESAKFAQKYSMESIKNAQKVGKGLLITQKKNDPLILELSKAIKDFTKIKNIYRKIPECQTNFVYSKNSPKSIKDVIGISGRIVKMGKNVGEAGNLEYGGSTHVATAVLSMNKKFSHIRSGINIKFQVETISKMKKNGFKVTSYDRTKEPRFVKNKEGSSIKWGITQAIKNSSQPPDAIFHKGDFGKEPMIIIFGNSPQSILKKISKIT